MQNVRLNIFCADYCFSCMNIILDSGCLSIKLIPVSVFVQRKTKRCSFNVMSWDYKQQHLKILGSQSFTRWLVGLRGYEQCEKYVSVAPPHLCAKCSNKFNYSR